MPELKPYGEGKYPQLTDESGGTGASKPYCAGANGSKPAPVEKVITEVRNALNEAQLEIDNILAIIEKRTQNLADNFGSKFISINGKGLDFVDVGTVTHLKNTISTSITNTITTINNFESTCQAGEEAIIAHLGVLETNEAEHKALLDEQTKLNNEKSSLEGKAEKTSADEDRLSKIKTRLEEIETELENYKEVSDPLNCGEWQKGGA